MDVTEQVRAGHALCEFLGYEHDELVGPCYQNVMHVDDLPLDGGESARLISGEVARFTHERRFLRKDCRVIWGLATVALLRDADGLPIKRIAQVQDISERKVAERALRESEAQLRTQLETAHEGVRVVDQTGGRCTATHDWGTCSDTPLRRSSAGHCSTSWQRNSCASCAIHSAREAVAASVLAQFLLA